MYLKQQNNSECGSDQMHESIEEDGELEHHCGDAS